jgi:hypothetical protein
LRFWTRVGSSITAIEGQYIDVEIRLTSMIRSLFRLPLVSPFSGAPIQGFGPWIPPYKGLNITPSGASGFVERLIVQSSSSFGLSSLNPVNVTDQPISLPQVPNFQFVVPIGNDLVTLTGERVFVRLGIALPYDNWLETARVASLNFWMWTIRPISDFQFQLALFTPYGAQGLPPPVFGPAIFTPAYLLRISDQNVVPPPPAEIIA